MNYWQRVFYREDSGFRNKIFRIPHRDLPKFVRLLRTIKARNVLDLGCGTGRHVIALAKKGFRVYGMDAAPKAVATTKSWLRRERLRAEVKVGDIYKKLPYPNDFFDGIISIKVLHHARLSKIKKLTRELERVMRDGGILMVEVPKKEKGRIRSNQKEVEPGTFIPLNGSEVGIPHHIFASKDELRKLFARFRILDIHLTGKDKKGTPSPHYTLFAKLVRSSQWSKPARDI